MNNDYRLQQKKHKKKNTTGLWLCMGMVVAVCVAAFLIGKESYSLEEERSLESGLLEIFDTPQITQEESDAQTLQEERTEEAKGEPEPSDREGESSIEIDLPETLNAETMIWDFPVSVENSLITTFGGLILSSEKRAKLQGLIDRTENQGDLVGFLMVDIFSGQGIAYNAGETFYSASSIKGPYLISLAEGDPGLMDNFGQECTDIAVSSDNAAYEKLYYLYGSTLFNKWCTEAGTVVCLGIDESALYSENYTYYSAEDLARLWLLNYYYIGSDSNVEAVSELFEQPEDSAINTVLGDLYTTQSKAGWIGDDLHSAIDAGIIYTDTSPYVLAVLTDYYGDLKELEPYVYQLDQIHSEITDI